MGQRARRRYCTAAESADIWDRWRRAQPFKVSLFVCLLAYRKPRATAQGGYFRVVSDWVWPRSARCTSRDRSVGVPGVRSNFELAICELKASTGRPSLPTAARDQFGKLSLRSIS
jgi:hypothetical protein